MQRIDLNADCGEGFDDAGLMEYVTSANIACGGHTGSSESMARTVALAVEAGVVIGAHPSFMDRGGFGRVPLGHGATGTARPSAVAGWGAPRALPARTTKSR